MKLTLKHMQQPFPWGCQYYGLYCLVGDERLLEDVTECQTTRFEERARELGYYLYYVYADISCSVPMPVMLWESLFNGEDYANRILGYDVPFLIDINSLKYEGVFHTVGLVLTGRHGCLHGRSENFISVKVFDPGTTEVIEFETLIDFLGSAYGRVYVLKQVMMVDELNEAFPKFFGPDGPHVKPAVREAWAASQEVHHD